MNLNERVALIQDLFEMMHGENASNWQSIVVAQFRKAHPELNDDLDFCFEVLAGKHKVGYIYLIDSTSPAKTELYDDYTIKRFYNDIIKRPNTTEDEIRIATLLTPPKWQLFIDGLVNREYKLGYSNKAAMTTNLSPMLAKKYPDSHRGQMYYIQEKLDGNRCIAYYDNGKWNFQSRSGKPLNVNFDMSWATDFTNLIFDGEIMTLGKAGTRDFNKTSGSINGKYTDKSSLHYFIYDIINKHTYNIRLSVLKGLAILGTGSDCSILPVLDKITVNLNPEYNWKLDEYLDMIVSKGGEGLILRDPDAVYQNGKRTDALLKYKKTQTMDLRIVGWVDGKGKYEGMIGSFVCRSDDDKYLVNVAGITDKIRSSDPNKFIGEIVEVAYFDISKSPNNDYYSLRFPRLKKFRSDKNETSEY